MLNVTGNLLYDKAVFHTVKVNWFLLFTVAYKTTSRRSTSLKKNAEEQQKPNLTSHFPAISP